MKKYGEALGAAESSIHPEAMQLLQFQPWPGNVRELENVVRKTLLVAGGYTINSDHVRVAISRSRSPAESGDETLRDMAGALLAAAQRGELAEAAEREMIGQAIQLTNGNQLQAARLLGISRLTLREKLTQFGLRPAPQKDS
jgi:DNA-binding NtrC family response regulator